MGTEMFAVYSDESGCFHKRYQAIGAVSGKTNDLAGLRHELKGILSTNSIKEIKFSEVTTHSPKVKAAQLFIKKGIDHAKLNKIRIDVLIWDTRDSRHSLPKRDNVANLERLYYKIFRHIFERWMQIEWEIYPDEQSAIDWNGITEYLNATKTPRRKPNILTLFEQERKEFNPRKIEPLESHIEPLIQIADLFAGMACFTRENGRECLEWLESQKGKNQQSLFDEEKKADRKISKAKCNRFALVGMLSEICKSCRLRVSLREKGYLWTPVPANPVNFWNYEPQHPDDKAPTK